MRPIRVEFQAFGPYADHEMVDFESLSSKGLFLICGKTGIGKTMILDAMTFALYGKSSGHGRDDFEAMRCTGAKWEKTTFVRFEFENHGIYYRFERRLEPKRKRLAAAYDVSVRGDDGHWHTMMENAKEKAVNEKAAEIIGLEYEQFRQVIVLPQGQFERFLTSNSNEKEKILTSIFGKEQWQKIAERFYQKAEERKNELTGLQQRIRNRLNEEGCDSIEELEQMQKAKQSAIKLLDKAFQEKDYDRLIQRNQGLLRVASRFKDLHKAQTQVEKLERMRAQRTEWENRAQEAKRAEMVRPLLEQAKREQSLLNRRMAEEKTAQKEADRRRQAYKEASGQLQLHLEQEESIEALKVKKTRYENGRREYEGLEENEKQLRQKKRKVTEAKKAEAAAGKKREEAAKRIAQTRSDHIRLQKEHGELLDAYLAGITGELAAQLKPGMPCPVCGSTEHPHRAQASEGSVAKAEVDAKKQEEEQMYQVLQKALAEQEQAENLFQEKHRALNEAEQAAAVLEAQLEDRKTRLIEGIPTSAKLKEKIAAIQDAVETYIDRKKELTEKAQQAKDADTKAGSRIAAAQKETLAARKSCEEAEAAVEKCLRENGFSSRKEAERMMRSAQEREELDQRIARYDADAKSAAEMLANLQEELKGIEEPDAGRCEEIVKQANDAKAEYRANRAVLEKETGRIGQIVRNLKKDGCGIEERIREAEEDFVFAKKLRGDSGTGLQRYVLGIMFSTVIEAANRMLELVHGGRYRLFRSDEKAQGSNKRGLELKVFDRSSGENEGRFVNTLSGGEKFLVSLALSIGMSTVAQKSGIRIEALFIDEGFGSLDEDSIGDAISILNSIRDANGLVGIISHVQLLQEQIPAKLQVTESAGGSHIVQTVG